MSPEVAIAVAIFGVLGSGVAFITFWMKLGDRIGQAAAAAKSAKEETAELREEVRECREALNAADKAFGLYREMVAREYINREMLRDHETRMTAAINAIGATSAAGITAINQRLDSILRSLGELHAERRP